jgi:hypothetical protein
MRRYAICQQTISPALAIVFGFSHGFIALLTDGRESILLVVASVFNQRRSDVDDTKGFRWARGGHDDEDESDSCCH